MRTIKMVVQYDGTSFAGWQIQPNGRSIQAVLSDAIREVTGEEVNPTGSGRTDAGVHALGQVCHFRTESRLSTESLRRALNANLPESIVARSVEDAPDGFHAQRDAKGKLYRYIFYDGSVADVFMRRYVWQVHHRLDEAVMNAAARRLVGTHDFRCFASKWPNRATSVRTIWECGLTRQGDFVTLSVAGNGFLYNMVRAIAGTLYEVGRGKWPPERVGEILEGGERKSAGPTAPAQGLFLVEVRY